METTDKLYELLKQKTKQALEKKILDAQLRFEDEIDTRGTSISVFLKVKDLGFAKADLSNKDSLVSIQSRAFFIALRDAVFTEQFERELQREVTNFLGSFENLRQQISYLEANGLSNEG